MRDFFQSIKWRWQILTRGWSDGEMWDLYYHIAKRYLPHLKQFRKRNLGYPGGMTKKQWDKILDKIIFAFQCIADKKGLIIKDCEKVQEGCELFGEYFLQLWM